MRGIAVIAAAGSGTRAGVDKVWTKMQGEVVLAKSARPFLRCPLIDDVVIVVREDKVEEAETLFSGEAKPVHVVKGGASRSESVRRALAYITAYAGEKDILVAIHDGARPFVKEELVERCLMRAAKEGSAVPVVPCSDSVRRIAEGRSYAVNRSELAMVQTPQCFDLGKLVAAYEKAGDATDDASIFEAKYGSVSIVEGDAANKKITYLSDIYEGSGSRVGIGFDVHQLVPERRLILGGVTIPFEKGLLGHSDADVLTHAIMDALLTAADLPDIGHFFPPDDPKFEGADSIKLLDEAYAAVRGKGFACVNVSATILAERPKLALYLPEMEDTVARALSLPKERVRFAATTTEKLGIVGEGKGMASEAVVLLERCGN